MKIRKRISSTIFAAPVLIAGSAMASAGSGQYEFCSFVWGSDSHDGWHMTFSPVVERHLEGVSECSNFIEWAKKNHSDMVIDETIKEAQKRSGFSSPDRMEAERQRTGVLNQYRTFVMANGKRYVIDELAWSP